MKKSAYLPVIKTVPYTLDTVQIYEAVSRNSQAPACILESAAPGYESRYSYVCHDAKHSAHDLHLIKEKLTRYSPPAHATIPFIGGAVGYIGHEAVSLIESIVKKHPVDPFKIPNVCLYFFHQVIVIDHEKKEMHFVASIPFKKNAASKKRAQTKGLRLIENMEKMLETANKQEDPVKIGEVTSNMTETEFTDMVLRAKSHIEKGDVFQVVLSQRFRASYRGTGLELYKALRKLNPSPYMFYMHFKGSACRNMVVLGASPEVMVGIEKKGTEKSTAPSSMRIRPIAGTRRRGKNAEEDAASAAELIADPKERAEHMMLVDLARNDIGKYCKADSIELPTLMHVENYSHVMHIVSEVQGELRDGIHPLDACLGSLPAGTLSGAPKVRALQIISELEKSQRGLYGGAFGFFTDTSLDTCIFIRSAMLLDGVLSWQSGAGIVADSVPESEYQETIAKARAIKAALESLI